MPYEVVPFDPRADDQFTGIHGAPVNATPYRWVDPTAIPPRQWLFARHFIRKFLSVTVSAGGVGKSSQELLDAMSMASGRNLLTGDAITPRSVWYWNGEDPLEELQRRVQAIALRYGLTKSDLGGRLFLDSGRDQRLKIALDDRQRGVTVNRPLVGSIVETLSSQGIDALILDPFVSTHNVPENDNGAIDQVAKEFSAIAEQANCAVEVVHHVRKSNSTELTVEDARGAVALISAARSVRVLNPMTVEEAARAGVDVAERRLFFRVDNGKANLVPPASGASWRRLVGVALGNGSDVYPEDSVGVVTAWTWPDAFHGLTVDTLRAVQRKISGSRWRENHQASDWVGIAVAEVVGLNLRDKADRERARALIKRWLQTGALKVVRGTDEKCRPRPYVEVGQWAN